MQLPYCWFCYGAYFLGFSWVYILIIFFPNFRGGHCPPKPKNGSVPASKEGISSSKKKMCTFVRNRLLHTHTHMYIVHWKNEEGANPSTQGVYLGAHFMNPKLYVDQELSSNLEWYRCLDLLCDKLGLHNKYVPTWGRVL